jgi:hypothetical protein
MTTARTSPQCGLRPPHRAEQFCRAWLAAGRNRRGHLQTGVYTMRRDDRTVTLIGACHVGRPGYYAQIHQLVLGLIQAGAELHFEGLHAERRETEPVERLLAEAAAPGLNLNTVEAAGQVLGLVSQRRVLTPLLQELPDARNIDVSTVDVFRALSAKKIATLSSDEPGLIEEIPQAWRPTAARLILWALRHVGNPALLLGAARGSRAHFAVIVDRNALAMYHALDTARTRDVVLLWGANHLPGMLRRLRRAGFILVRTEWVEAF